MDKNKKDIWAGGTLVVFSLLNLLASFDIAKSSMNILSSAAFPRFCLAALLLIGLILLVKGSVALRRQAQSARAELREGKSPAVAELLRVGAVMGILALSIALLPLIGFIPTGTLYLFATISLLNPKKPGKKERLIIALVSITVPVIVFFLFTRVFQLMLPLGSLWG